MPTPDEFKNYNQVPDWYTIKIILPGTAGAKQGGAVGLRPSPFVCTRVTWATNADIFRIAGPYFFHHSPQGRCVEVRFGDAFTRFFSERSALVSAVFGDSDGFLDLPSGLLFQGSQPLEVELTRLFWASIFDTDEVPPVDTRWDFVFHGISLLPAGVNQSGSAG
jgi:hypothetical protein